MVLPQRLTDVGDEKETLLCFYRGPVQEGKMYTKINDFGYVFCDYAS